MESNNDLKKIWNKQKIARPKVEVLYAQAKRLKRRGFLKLIAVNLTSLLSIIFIGSIGYYYQPEIVTTKIGIILTILAMVIFILSYNKQFSVLADNTIEPNNKEYLQQLIKLKEMQIIQQTSTLNIYFILLSLGIGLYLFEHVLKMPIILGVIIYATVTIWFAICWIYLRPKVIEKEDNKINQLIDKFKKVHNQLI